MKENTDMQSNSSGIKKIAYWAITILLSLILISGGFFQIINMNHTVDGITRLGYPVYFVTILGFWKVMGGIAILLPRYPRLKEWAYSGIFFEMTGAAASHLVSGSEMWHVYVTLSFAALAVVSWALRPASRRNFAFR